jgi:hypothetical protein
MSTNLTRKNVREESNMAARNNLPEYMQSGSADLWRESAKGNGKDGDAEEGACPAFGYLRGLRERALAIEFRFRDGNSEWQDYGCLTSWRFNPSAGILLKFAGGDAVTLVLIRGSNLDALVNNAVNLTDRGLQRHRITYIREMDEEELRAVGEGGPTIDRIEVGEFASTEEQQEWLKTNAQAFVR